MAEANARSALHDSQLNGVLDTIVDDLTNIRAKLAGILSGSVTYDPASLVDAAGETKSLTVTGAALGDFVLVSAPYDLQDITVTAYVQATDTVEIRVQNEGGATVDLASGTWRVRVLPQASFAAPVALTTTKD